MLTAQPINCTLKHKRGEKSSTDAMIGLLQGEFEKREVKVRRTVRVSTLDILPGVSSDEGRGDDWPDLRARILDADILIFGTPIWLGQPSSIAKRVLERMDAFLDEMDDANRMPSYPRVAVFAIVGNEDGAHAVTAQLSQALNDLGWTIPAVAACYWVGEAMGSVNFKDLKATPRNVGLTAKMVASNASHLAKLLKEAPYPG